MLYSLLFLTLLGVGIGCRKKVEEIKPPVVVSPPTSTTEPTSTTPTSPTVSFLDAYPPGCQVVKTILKRRSYAIQDKSLIIDPEILVLEDFTQVPISLATITHYVYDSQGRIIEARNQEYYGRVYSTRFVYKSDTLYISGDPNIGDGKDTLLLNKQGFIEYNGLQIGNSRGRKYNQDGQLINRYGSPDPKLVNRYENGNLIWGVDTQKLRYINGVLTEAVDRSIQYGYDTRYANLPNIYQYYGRQSRNLPTEELMSSADFQYPVHVRNYSYTFDERGRVKRRIYHSTILNPLWLLTDGVVGTTDYEYECP